MSSKKKNLIHLDRRSLSHEIPQHIDISVKSCLSEEVHLEKVLVFAVFILHKKKSVKFTRNIKPIIWMRLKCWEESK